MQPLLSQLRGSKSCFLLVSSLCCLTATSLANDTHFIQQPSLQEWTPPVVKEMVLRNDLVVKREYQRVQGGRHVCIQECEAPVEEPVKVLRSTEPCDEQLHELTEAQQLLLEQQVAAKHISISATVYYEGEKPFSHIRLQCGEDKVEAWSSMHFAEMVTGISHYKARGVEYYCFVGHGIERTVSASEAGCPVLREKLNGEKARFLVEGERDEACTAVEALRGLHALYNQEKETLQAAYQVRLANQRKAAEWRKANPEKPKDITIRFWKRDLSSQPNNDAM